MGLFGAPFARAFKLVVLQGLEMNARSRANRTRCTTDGAGFVKDPLTSWG